MDFAKLVHALQYLLGKLAPCYNYVLDISAPLQIHSGHWRFLATDAGELITNMYVAVPEISLPV